MALIFEGEKNPLQSSATVSKPPTICYFVHNDPWQPEKYQIRIRKDPFRTKSPCTALLLEAHDWIFFLYHFSSVLYQFTVFLYPTSQRMYQ